MKSDKVLISVKCRIPILILSALLLVISGIHSVNAQPASKRQSSIDAFSKGNFEQAYAGFKELLITYPKDPLYKYYSGVCLIKLGREPEEAYRLLQQAQQGSVVVRTIPPDALFWLGRAQQMTGRFTEAILSYNEFTEINGKKSARDLEIPIYLQQCQDKKGQITETDSKKASPESRILTPEKIPDPVAVQKNVESGEKKKIQDTIPEAFDHLLSEALEYQSLADSLALVAEGWKIGLENLDYKGKTDLKVRIAETEKLSASYQKKADQKYDEAQVSMNTGSFSGVKKDAREQKADSSAVKYTVPENQLSKPAAVVKKDSVQVKPADVYTIFEVKPRESISGNKVPVNAAIPPGLIYRIQVAVFKNQVALPYFKGLTPVYGFRAPGSENTTYYAGLFRRIADARKALVTVRQKGFRDAFIVALSGGKQISIERAAVLEKDWAKKPFISVQSSRQPAAVDTIPPELCFRIEVMRSVKPVKPEVLEEMKKIAGERGLDSETQTKGLTVYLIGKFITYESASRYADLLVRNGYRDAKVVARLGKKEVPVVTARELFEKIE